MAHQAVQVHLDRAVLAKVRDQVDIQDQVVVVDLVAHQDQVVLQD